MNKLLKYNKITIIMGNTITYNDKKPRYFYEKNYTDQNKPKYRETLNDCNGNKIICNECIKNNTEPEYFTKDAISETGEIKSVSFYQRIPYFNNVYSDNSMLIKYTFCYICSNNHKQPIQTKERIRYIEFIV